MKKIILIFICIGLSHNFYGQQEKDYAYFSHWIDSLSSVYAVEQLKDTYDARFSFYEANLSTIEKKKLLDKIRSLFEQNKYANLYRLGHRMIHEMWSVAPGINSLDIKQKIMELYLQYYFYPGTEQIIDSDILGSESYYTKKAKQRIIEILEEKKTKEEYDIYLNLNRLTYDSYPVLWKEASQIMKKREIQNDTVLKQIRDSIMADYVYRNTESYFESLQIDPELIKMIGLLGMKECIPILQQNLQLCIQKGCINDQIKAYRYALARLGDKKQRQYILDNMMSIDFSDDGFFHRKSFAYFRDNEMIWKYIEVNYFSDKEIDIISNVSIPSSLKTMNDIYPYIKNIPEVLKYPSLSDDMNDHYKWAKALYKWLMTNKNNVKFDYGGEKEWFW